MTRMWLSLLLVVAIAGPAAAQSGHLAGVVRDPSGGVLPGVTMRASLKDDNGGTTRTVRTDGAGRYDLSLADGTWTVTASLPGFASIERQVAVLQGTTEQWSPELRVGMLQETMVITAGMQPSRTEASSAQRAAPPAAPAPPLAAVRGTPTPTALPPTPAPGTPAPVRVGGNIKAPRKIVNVNPGYPPEAVAQGASGVVILEATIGPDGRVADVRTLRPIDPLLTRAAADALRGWEFTPTLLNGVPVAVVMNATFQFTLN